MMSPIGINQFKVGGRYLDAVGRKWEVRQIFKVNGWLCLMLSRWTPATLFGLTTRWHPVHPAIVEDDGKTATVLLDEGFTTLYAEEVKDD